MHKHNHEYIYLTSEMRCTIESPRHSAHEMIHALKGRTHTVTSRRLPVQVSPDAPRPEGAQPGPGSADPGTH
jgi:hypothetical protein